MAIGLKLRGAKKLGRKIEKGIRTFGRGLSKAVSVVEPFAPMIAGAIGGPEAAVLTSQLLGNVKKVGGGASQFTGKGALKNIGKFAQEKLPELAKAGEVRIGEMVAKKTGQSSIQAN
jgi:hypothetical protein